MFQVRLEKVNRVDFTSRTHERLQSTCAVAKEALSWPQKKMKRCFEKRAVERHFAPGEKVLVLLPSPGSALAARFTGPYVIQNKLSDTDYVILTPERRRKTRLCHVNVKIVSMSYWQNWKGNSFP